MKKQIFFLIVLAIFAVSSAFAQALPGSAPRGVSCVDDPLHPMAGKSYPYKAASNQIGNYTFWATKDVNFITTAAGVTTTNIATMLLSPTTTPVGADLLATSPNYGTAAAADLVDITWSDAVLAGTTAAAPTFVAVNQDGTCANNFKVWAIEPIVAFTVDIKNIQASDSSTSLAYDVVDAQCADQVRGARYNAGTLEYNFGKQVLYYEVVAANFTASWTPTFVLTGVAPTATPTIQWAYDKAFTSPVTVTSGVASPSPVLTNETSTTGGVSIYVRVIIQNNTSENLGGQTISLAVDGQNSVSQWDIDNGNGTTCVATTDADLKDIITQTINPRPTVTPVAPSAPFVGTNATAK